MGAKISIALNGKTKDIATSEEELVVLHAVVVLSMISITTSANSATLDKNVVGYDVFLIFGRMSGNLQLLHYPY